MDPATLVDAQIEEAQQLLDTLADTGFVVKAASWVKPLDDGRWSLYIVAPIAERTGSLEDYDRIVRVFRSIGAVALSTSSIKLVGTEHRVGRGLLDVLQRYSDRAPAWLPGSLLGGTTEDEIYLYAPGKAVNVTVYGLTYRGYPQGGTHWSLEPHDPDQSLAVGKGKHQQLYPAELGIDRLVAAPARAALRRDQSGELVLSWERNGTRVQSSANEVLSLAKERRYGFRLLGEPSPTSARQSADRETV